jgi:aralkylamine N-acetyltransferase
MGFWKNLFSGTDSSASDQDSKFRSVPNCDREILFSSDRNLDLYELEELCDAVGWSRRPIRKVRIAIEHSFIVVTMWHKKGDFKRLIGFARATSDHAFNATVWDVVVHPEYQGKGLGKELMREVIHLLRKEDISNISLFADGHVVTFYQQLGFSPDPEGIKGMFWYPPF